MITFKNIAIVLSYLIAATILPSYSHAQTSNSMGGLYHCTYACYAHVPCGQEDPFCWEQCLDQAGHSYACKMEQSQRDEYNPIDVGCSASQPLTSLYVVWGNFAPTVNCSLDVTYVSDYDSCTYSTYSQQLYLSNYGNQLNIDYVDPNSLMSNDIFKAVIHCDSNELTVISREPSCTPPTPDPTDGGPGDGKDGSGDGDKDKDLPIDSSSNSYQDARDRYNRAKERRGGIHQQSLKKKKAKRAEKRVQKRKKLRKAKGK